ncbi:MAG: hypothetical protein IKS10_06460 [Lachnospiraceae bacterium]|nr:hypothetical protein [Lachnospiraceae bacterium]
MLNNRNYFTKWILLICLIMLTSCKHETSNSESILDSAGTEFYIGPTSKSDEDISLSPIHIIDASITYTTEPVSSSVENIDLSEEDSLPHIIWDVGFSKPIRDNQRAAIQQIIEEKGIPCHVDFVDNRVVLGHQYAEWFEEQKVNGTVPDIFNSGYWEKGELEAAYFARKELLPLNEFLMSDEGRSLRECFSENEWKRTELNGSIYTLPDRWAPDEEVYQCIYVNDQYKDVFEEVYDGSYGSLRMVRNRFPDDDLCFVFSGIGDITTQAFLGCHVMYCLSYNDDDGKFIDLTKQIDTKETFSMIYEDLRDGIIKIEGYLDELPDNMLIYVKVDYGDGPEGFTRYRFSYEPYFSHFGGEYGVSAVSSHKDLALQVLNACYSDPRLASLVHWGYEDPEGWNEVTQYMNSIALHTITGFLPELSGDEYDAVARYVSDIGHLRENLVEQDGRGGWYTNPNYLYQLGYFFDHPPDYGDLFEKVNEQLQEWLKNK